MTSKNRLIEDQPVPQSVPGERGLLAGSGPVAPYQ
jgi:hypothetical protein